MRIVLWWIVLGICGIVVFNVAFPRHRSSKEPIPASAQVEAVGDETAQSSGPVLVMGHYYRLQGDAVAVFDAPQRSSATRVLVEHWLFNIDPGDEYQVLAVEGISWVWVARSRHAGAADDSRGYALRNMLEPKSIHVRRQ